MTTTRKISTKIWRPILDKLDKKIEAACLRRDAYLSKVLEVEVEMLDREVSIPNSLEAFNFVSKRLDKLDRKLVTLTLSENLVDRLNEVCTKKRINRDSFFNRLFLLLAASPKFIDQVFLMSTEWRTEVWSEHRNDGPFFQNSFYPLEQDIDPFWAIRAGIEIDTQDNDFIDYIEPVTAKTIKAQRNFDGSVYPLESLYTYIFNDKKLKDTDLYGLNTYLPDWLVPEHPDALAYKKTLDELLDI